MEDKKEPAKNVPAYWWKKLTPSQRQAVLAGKEDRHAPKKLR